jgi:hypothetical protein
LEGVQHPAPPLPINFERDKAADKLYVSSEFARAVKNGEVLTANPPNTQIWVVAYARVQQADGKGWRNIQLGRQRALPPKRSNFRSHKPADISARADWSGAEMRDLLSQWGLPPKTPMGFLAVELLPEPNGRFGDPLGGDLGQVRILRSSRLISTGDTCWSLRPNLRCTHSSGQWELEFPGLSHVGGLGSPT